MKHFIKLAAVFVSILLVLVAAFNIDTIISLITGNIESGPPKGKSQIEQLQARLEEGWRERNDWDKDFFQDMYIDIDLLSADYNVSTQRDFNSEQAISKIKTKIFQEWGKPNCNKGVVDKYVNAARFVKKTDSKATHHNDIVKIEQVYKEYDKALKLAQSRFTLKVSFNGTSWRSYQDYRASQESSINSLKQSSIYNNYLSRINVIRVGLSQSELNSRFAASRNTYYAQLETAIYNYYEKAAKTEENRRKLNEVRGKYNNEVGTESARLQRLYTWFREQIGQPNYPASKPTNPKPKPTNPAPGEYR
jgi:hypothetical protein